MTTTTESTTPSTNAPQFYLVRCSGFQRRFSPDRAAGFTRRGVRFVEAWRLIQLGEVDNLKADPVVVSAESFAAIKRETEDGPGKVAALIMKSATADEAKEWLVDHSQPRDRLETVEQENSTLKQKNAELEARLLKLEMAVQGGAAADKAKKS